MWDVSTIILQLIYRVYLIIFYFGSPLTLFDFKLSRFLNKHTNKTFFDNLSA